MKAEVNIRFDAFPGPDVCLYGLHNELVKSKLSEVVTLTDGEAGWIEIDLGYPEYYLAGEYVKVKENENIILVRDGYHKYFYAYLAYEHSYIYIEVICDNLDRMINGLDHYIETVQQRNLGENSIPSAPVFENDDGGRDLVDDEPTFRKLQILILEYKQEMSVFR